MKKTFKRASASVDAKSCKIQKTLHFTHFDQKNTHISWCKIVHKCTTATVTVHICTVTVTLTFNIYIYIYIYISLSISLSLFLSDLTLTSCNGHINSVKKKKTNIQPPTQHNPKITTATQTCQKTINSAKLIFWWMKKNGCLVWCCLQIHPRCRLLGHILYFILFF